MGKRELKVLLRPDVGSYQATKPIFASLSCLILVAPWFEHKGEKEVVGKTRENATLFCSATGFPLNVEWKSKNGVLYCNGTFFSLDRSLHFYQLRVHCKVKSSL